MFSCTFFGHRECPSSLEPKLRTVLEMLITKQNVTMFYVGNQGQFDALVRRVLQQLKWEYPQIHYAVVLAYLPAKQSEYENYSDTMLPEGIEGVHPRFAISWRNRWMLGQSEFAVTYITHSWGGAAQYAAKAQRAGLTIINLSEK